MFSTSGSWKTTAAGTVTAAGAALMGAGAMDWVKPQHKYPMMMVGFILTVAGPLLIGLFARDDDKTSSQVGAVTRSDSVLLPPVEAIERTSVLETPLIPVSVPPAQPITTPLQ